MQKVTYKDLSVTIREATVQDGLTALRISRVVSIGAAETELGFWTTFGTLCAQVDSASTKTLGFDPVGLATADEDTAKAAYQAYLKLPKKFSQRWEAAIEKENKEDDPATGPTPLPGDAPLAG